MWPGFHQPGAACRQEQVLPGFEPDVVGLDVGLRLGRDDGWLFSTLIRRGTEGKMGTQYDLSYPIRRSVFSGVGAFVHLQAFKGYGETLLEYDENKEAQYRIGVSLVR